MGTQPGYKYLKTYQLATVIYDLTMEFCAKFLPGQELMRQRTQMTQAGRSGKQNIAEGYLEKSLKMYIKLAGVSRGSFGELLEDYEDIARQKKIPVWEKNDQRVGAIRDIRVGEGVKVPDLPDNPEEAVNLLITLLHQENFLLDRQISALEKKFIAEGGYSEKLYQDRLQQRNLNKK
ncbi:MAG: four helix bundle suffix domain-containing protein [Patescibacteria group bacterium]|nr:four helix bundle suffix domain-containing protein [Patescibacteria group bacterium]